MLSQSRARVQRRWPRLQQIIATRRRLLDYHRALRFDQPGPIGALAARMRVRLERTIATIDRRLATEVHHGE